MEKKLKIGVFGASGRMGQALYHVSHQKNCLCYWGASSKNKAEGYKYQMIYPLLPLEPKEEVILRDVDVFIDFSQPVVLLENMRLVKELNRPYVCGVTGWGDNEYNEMKKLSGQVPVLWSANFSLGIAVLKQALRIFSVLGEDWSFVIEEIHHRHKKDAPSGTAKMLQEKLAEGISQQQIQNMVSIRGGGVLGEHSVLALGEFELLRFTHQTLDRRVFAFGAMQAAQWLQRQKAGFYTFDQMWQVL